MVPPKRRQTRRRQLTPEIEQWVKSKCNEGWNANEIFRMMENEVQFLNEKAALPSKRTVQRVVQETRIEDSSAPWDMSERSGEDARLILDVLKDVIMTSFGKKSGFSELEADWVLKVRKVAPDAKPFFVWLLARMYMELESKGNTDTSALDQYLAFTPWRSPYHFQNYAATVKEGWIKEDLLRLWGAFDAVWSGFEFFPDASRSVVSLDSSANRFLLEWRDHLQKPSVYHDTEKAIMTMARNPELYQKMMKAGHEARAKGFEFIRKKAKKKFAPEDWEAWSSTWKEYESLVNLEEGK